MLSHPIEHIEKCIYLVREHKVMLDSDLATLYCVSTKRLNEQVRRNKDRFPEDFMLQLTIKEVGHLRSRTATSSLYHGGRRYLPFAFTEHGAVMLASVLNSPVAVSVSIQVVRAFVRLREMISAHKELVGKFDILDLEVQNHTQQIQNIFETLQKLQEFEEPPAKPPRRIGFLT